MALYIPHSIFHLARRLYVRPETSEPYYVNEKQYQSFLISGLFNNNMKICEF